MARIVGRQRVRESSGTGLRVPEIIVFALVICGLVAGVRYYFFVYRVSPGYTLAQYFGAVKAGNVSAQYALIDDADKKQFFPSEKEYEQNAPQARGYTERISGVQMSEEKPDPKKPGVALVDATVSIRQSASGKQIYQTGTDSFRDTYALRKDKNGAWKVWLERSGRKLLEAKPSAPGNF